MQITQFRSNENLTTATGAAITTAAAAESVTVRVAVTTACYFASVLAADVADNTDPIVNPEETIFINLPVGGKVSLLAVTLAGRASVSVVKAQGPA